MKKIKFNMIMFKSYVSEVLSKLSWKKDFLYLGNIKSKISYVKNFRIFTGKIIKF